MPEDRDNPSLKDPELYEKLRSEGASEEKAARISNAAARDGRSSVGQRGGSAEDYDERTVAELRDRAKELGLEGYSRLRKSELIDLLRQH
ncbi:Rho termination factor N-terminal domain-containing protein [Microcella sp.]|uniref:Rho termination factor N-terminal domain-containing protein n=1 Tax=Microcella sp. TaxID=1913979 RepID=UPI002562750D|nr:Rho termination factor N-terminal domain-containing protein [Microcella sp.]MBX9470404.1 Rho termination factor N-terminal domain-containing protein [Microcella sp.]